MSSFDRLIRKVIPSAAHLSYNPAFRVLGNIASAVPLLIYPEYRELPPNHLRVRVGVGNRVIFNQAYHLQLGTDFWLPWLSSRYLNGASDIVEIGCGCGRIAHHLRGEWFTGSYIGIDIDQEMLDWDSKHFPPDKFTFMKSPHTSATYSATKTDQPSGIFAFPDNWKKDFVFSTSLYTHLLEPELRNYTSESYKVLRDGGTMYMSVFCLDSVELGNRWTFKNRIGEAYVENVRYPEAAVAYTREFLEKLCCEIGFREVTIFQRRGQSALMCRK